MRYARGLAKVDDLMINNMVVVYLVWAWEGQREGFVYEL
jgi:hypothetical protein